MTNYERAYRITDWHGEIVADELDTQPSALTQEEVDTIVSELTREPVTSISIESALRKLPDIGAGSGTLPEGFEKGCQKCNGVIEPGDEYQECFGNFYCRPCVEAIAEKRGEPDE